MKKSLIFLLLALLLLCFSACDEANVNGETNNTTDGQESTEETTPETNGTTNNTEGTPDTPSQPEEKYSEGLSYVFDHETQGYSVTGIGTCRDTDLIIPSVYDGYPVTSIAASSTNILAPSTGGFRGNQYITSVTIPSSVKFIGAYSFSNCTALKTVTLAEGIEKIDKGAFSGCTSLTAPYILPDSLTDLGYGIFNGCDKLTGCEHENGYYYGYKDNPYAILFRVKDTSVSSFTIHQNTKTIDENVFKDCNNITTFSIPEGIEKIGNFAFYGLTLQELRIPSTVKEMSSGAFAWCQITDVYIADLKSWCEIKLIEGRDSSYFGIKEAKQIFIKTDLLKSELVIPEGVTRIRDGAFEGWNFETVSFPSTLKEIGASAFALCPNLKNATIPNGVTTIKRHAFRECHGLEYVYIPSTVNVIEQDAFLKSSYANTTILTPLSEKPSGWHENWNGQTEGSSSNVIWNTTDMYTDTNGITYALKSDGTAEILYCDNKEIGSVDFSALVNGCTVTAIHEKAFMNCNKLTEIFIPSNIEYIGWGAFYGCDFYSCVIYAESVPEPEAWAPKTWNFGWNAYTGDRNGWNTLTVYWGYEGEYTDDNGLTYRLFSDKIATILSCDKTVTGNLVIPSDVNGYSVTRIMSDAFLNITGLKNVYIPKSVIEIGGMLFLGCNSIEKIYTEADTKPNSWDYQWNAYPTRINNIGTVVYEHFEVVWGCNLSDFPAE